MFILIECEDGSFRVRKKTAVKDVKIYVDEDCEGDPIARTQVIFYGKNLCPLWVRHTPKEFYRIHLYSS